MKLHLPIENAFIKDIDFNNDFFKTMKEESFCFLQTMEIRSKTNDRALIIRYKGQIVLFCSYKITSAAIYTYEYTPLPLTKRIVIDYFKTRLPDSLSALIAVLLRLSMWYKVNEILWNIPCNHKYYKELKSSLNKYDFFYSGHTSFGNRSVMRKKL